MPPYSVATLLQIDEWTADVRLYTFKVEPPIPFVAGQFVNLSVPDGSSTVSRSYSVWSAPEQTDGILQLCIKLFPGGRASEHLRRLAVGDTVQLSGAYGVFTLDQELNPVTMVATATGLAPFHSMLQHAANTGDNRTFYLYFGVRTEADLFALDLLDALSRSLNLTLYPCLSQPGPSWTGFCGRASKALLEQPVSEGQYLLCGNAAMVTELRAALKERGVERRRIRYEKYY